MGKRRPMRRERQVRALRASGCTIVTRLALLHEPCANAPAVAAAGGFMTSSVKRCSTMACRDPKRTSHPSSVETRGRGITPERQLKTEAGTAFGGRGRGRWWRVFSNSPTCLSRTNKTLREEQNVYSACVRVRVCVREGKKSSTFQKVDFN